MQLIPKQRQITTQYYSIISTGRPNFRVKKIQYFAISMKAITSKTCSEHFDAKDLYTCIKIWQAKKKDLQIKIQNKKSSTNKKRRKNKSK